MATNPRISQLAGMVKHYAPLKTKFGIEMVKLLATTNEFNTLPQWLQDHLLKVEQLLEQDKANVIEKHGDHNQKTHGRRRRASVETPSFTDSESVAITNYSTTATMQINHKLRGVSKRGKVPNVFDLSDSQIDTAVKNLDSAIGKSKLTENIDLHRELPITSLKSGLFGSTIGKTITDKGFLSLQKGTSVIPARSGFVKFKIKAKAGTTALDLSFVSPYAFGEVIFPRGTKIKINNVVGKDDDMLVIGEIVE